MEIKGEFNYKSAIALTPETIHDLDTLLQGYFTDLNYSATLITGSEISFSNLIEMLGFDNTLHLKICKLKIYGSRTNLTVYIFPTMSAFWSFNNTVGAVYVFTSTDDETLFIKKLKFILDDAKVPCSFIYKFSYKMIIFIIFNIISGFIGYSLAGNNLITKNYLQSDIMLFIISFIVVSSCILFAMAKFWNYFFPPIVFLWGKEIKAEERRKGWRTGIFWTVIIGGFAIGVFFLILSKIMN